MKKILKFLVYVAAALFVAMVGLVILGYYAGSSNKSEVGVLPACDSDRVKEEAKAAILNSPIGKTAGFEILDITGLKQITADSSTRICEGMFFTNAGKERSTITLSWINKEEGKWYIEIK